MSNPYPLLIETPNARLSRVMRHINGVFTQRYNRLKRYSWATILGALPRDFGQSGQIPFATVTQNPPSLKRNDYSNG
ncbi:hypothetical protein [Paraglaciecola sp. MB-3u-78]|uniref:hypothetical protein n=1 Tax=Paraglaciecola sp. MB-3u-78 TaxID=2058332 RepID=UPI000CACE54B|nr:hypothetical protein [Paraglaciecola sp. MB-3u-78]PKG93356.1 hypothetical protein CXF95_27715 [Paraglaciecola sp. MB-3u-78]